MLDKLQQVQDLFQNPEICSIRIVANPEKMVVQEAKRAFTYLQLYGYNVDSIIVNRILPEEAQSKFFSKYFTAQIEHLKEIENSFEPIPIKRVLHSGEEVFGLDLLNDISDQIYGTEDPTKLFYKEKPFKIVEKEDSFQVQIHLPFIKDSDYELKKTEKN